MTHLAMIEAAEAEGKLRFGGHVVEYTGGAKRTGAFSNDQLSNWGDALGQMPLSSL